MNTHIKENATAILHIYTNTLIRIIHCNQVDLNSLTFYTLNIKDICKHQHLNTKKVV